MTFDPASLTIILLILTAWGAAFLAALWLSLVIWTFRDIRSRARDSLARILAVLVVAVLFLPGILIYLILCPYCGTPAPGMRREGLTLDEALRPLPVETEEEEEQQVVEG